MATGISIILLRQILADEAGKTVRYTLDRFRGRPRCNKGEEMPERFVDWIYWNLGNGSQRFICFLIMKKCLARTEHKLGTLRLRNSLDVFRSRKQEKLHGKKPYGISRNMAQFLLSEKVMVMGTWLRDAEATSGKELQHAAVKKLGCLRPQSIVRMEGNMKARKDSLQPFRWAEWEEIMECQDGFSQERKKPNR